MTIHHLQIHKKQSISSNHDILICSALIYPKYNTINIPVIHKPENNQIIHKLYLIPNGLSSVYAHNYSIISEQFRVGSYPISSLSLKLYTKP